MSIFFDFVTTSLFRSKKHCFLSRISKNVSFWLFLFKKNIWENGRFFDKSQRLTPLQNVDFLDYVRTPPFRSKKHSFLSRISKNVSFWLSLFKRTDKEKVDFFRNTMDLPLCKMSIFFEFVWTSLLRSKKLCFLSRISKNLSFWLFWLKKKNVWKKGRFFDKNHGLTPLQNVDFFDFFRTSLFRSNKHSFLSRRLKNLSFWLFLVKKKHIRKRSIFWQKPWTNPFPNCRFF